MSICTQLTVSRDLFGTLRPENTCKLRCHFIFHDELEHQENLSSISTLLHKIAVLASIPMFGKPL
jgi:hypothetical protein